MEPLKLDLLREDIKKTVELYLFKLLDIHRDNIVSILLYGSATGKFYVRKSSDINLLVVFKDIEFGELKSSLRLVNRGIRKKIAAPLFLSLQQIENSKDVFPIEFLEIKENNILLYGKNLFSNMKIDEKYVRLFCEREIKGKLIRLREAYLEIGLKRKGIEALMKESLYTLMPIFRALLRIKGLKPNVDKENILKDLSDFYSLDRDVFLAILKDRLNDEKILGKDIQIYFEKYIEQIKNLAQAVDKL